MSVGIHLLAEEPGSAQIIFGEREGGGDRFLLGPLLFGKPKNQQPSRSASSEC